MTVLEKKAEEWIKEHSGLIGSYKYVNYDCDSMQQAFIAGAKAMQDSMKEKEELKKENEHIRYLLGTAIIVLNRIENPEVPYEKVVDNLRKLKELLRSVE